MTLDCLIPELCSHHWNDFQNQDANIGAQKYNGCTNSINLSVRLYEHQKYGPNKTQSSFGLARSFCDYSRTSKVILDSGKFSLES